MDTEQSAHPATPRRRDSTATRAAILQAARVTFTRLGYDGAGVRDIAREAGVDARLIGRYFGSKEALFTQVVDDVYDKTLLMVQGATEEAARALLTAGEQSAPDGLLLTIRSATNERAAQIMRESIERNYQQELTEGLTGPDAAGRAALLISICSGVQLMRTLMGSTQLTSDDVGRLLPYLKAALDAVAEDPSS
jgi:AcrR family transcriptional regulator